MKIPSTATKALAGSFLIANLLAPTAAAQMATEDGTLNPSSGIVIAYEPIGQVVQGGEFTLAVATNRDSGLCSLDLLFENEVDDDGEADGEQYPTLDLGSDGTCAWNVKLPDDAPLGMATFDVQIQSGIAFNIAFVRFEVLPGEGSELPTEQASE